jgi:hypothetical protein
MRVLFVLWKVDALNRAVPPIRYLENAGQTVIVLVMENEIKVKLAQVGIQSRVFQDYKLSDRNLGLGDYRWIENYPKVKRFIDNFRKEANLEHLNTFHDLPLLDYCETGLVKYLYYNVILQIDNFERVLKIEDPDLVVVIDLLGEKSISKISHKLIHLDKPREIPVFICRTEEMIDQLIEGIMRSRDEKESNFGLDGVM